MDRAEAYRLLAEQIAAYRRLTYDELRQLVGNTYSHRTQLDGWTYEIEIEIAWLRGKKGHILVDGMVGGVEWGSPMERFDEHFISAPP